LVYELARKTPLHLPRAEDRATFSTELTTHTLRRLKRCSHIWAVPGPPLFRISLIQTSIVRSSGYQANIMCKLIRRDSEQKLKGHPGIIRRAETGDGTMMFLGFNIATIISFADGSPVIEPLRKITEEVEKTLIYFNPSFQLVPVDPMRKRRSASPTPAFEAHCGLRFGQAPCPMLSLLTNVFEM
jgi:hypothetical protein